MCYAKCSLKVDKAEVDKELYCSWEFSQKGVFGAHPGILPKDFLVPDWEVSITHVQLIYSVWEIGFLHWQLQTTRKSDPLSFEVSPLILG